ncbi:MAG: Hint domain-containing protein [Paracoccaceae bacterium]|nr:Hint domain-containing protein [Paracoccaceae bacterium]
MTSVTSSGNVSFSATESGGVLTPTENFFYESYGHDVYDNGVGVGDGNADTGTDYFLNAGYPYSGYTIRISGDDYAMFTNGYGSYFIPYFNDVNDLSGLHGAAVNFPITQSGENAVVVNLCFLGGTMIATPDGERLVENLAIGDMVRTADGQDVAVKWLGKQVMKSAFANTMVDASRAPVCNAAGTLGNHSDLYVSADHGMIVDGMVINASALVNHDTIRFVPMSELPSDFTYYHVETAAHDVIIANGAPAETFIDYAGRAAFDNHQEYLDLYGAERIIPEMDRPRISSARMVPDAIKARLGIKDCVDQLDDTLVA